MLVPVAWPLALPLAVCIPLRGSPGSRLVAPPAVAPRPQAGASSADGPPTRGHAHGPGASTVTLDGASQRWNDLDPKARDLPCPGPVCTQHRGHSMSAGSLSTGQHVAGRS